MITTTIDLLEVVWTLAALPGLYYWLIDMRKARRDYAAIRTVTPEDGRHLWARFSRRLTVTFVLVESAFIVLGLVAMTRPAPPGDWLLRVVSISGLIFASIAIAEMAYRWQRVNREIVDSARARARREAEARARLATEPITAPDDDELDDYLPDRKPGDP